MSQDNSRRFASDWPFEAKKDRRGNDCALFAIIHIPVLGDSE